MTEQDAHVKHSFDTTAGSSRALEPDRIFAERRIALVVGGGARTPFAKAPGKLARFSSLALGEHVIRGLLGRLHLAPERVEQVVFGEVLCDPHEGNLARHLVFRSDLPHGVYAATVSSNCITGLVAIDMLAKDIALGRVNVGLAGGTESMSNVPLPLPPGAQAFWRSFGTARTLGARVAALGSFRPRFLVPLRPRPVEPFTGKTMGEHCEMMNAEFHVPRAVQDELALRSHRQAAAAEDAGILAEEIVPVGELTRDPGIRRETSLEALAKLPTIFDRTPQGTLTAGNSSFPTDGAAAVCLVAESTARELGLEVLAYIAGVEFAAIDPAAGLLMAPALAVPRLLARHGLTAAEIDLWEIHEAFAAQVAMNLQAWEQGWSRFPEIKPIGAVPRERVNVHGGSLALGHPFAATGPRLIYALARELKRRGARRGLLSACAAGGTACAMLLERPRND